MMHNGHILDVEAAAEFKLLPGELGDGHYAHTALTDEVNSLQGCVAIFRFEGRIGQWSYIMHGCHESGGYPLVK